MKCKNCNADLNKGIAVIKISDILQGHPDVIEVEITCDSCHAEMFAYISDKDLILDQC